METVRALLIAGLREVGLPSGEREVSLFLAYLEELRKWSRAYNLTALRKGEEIVTKHFLDSLLYLPLIPESCRDLCDVGSGAGFPGLPLAIVRPALRVTLVEPSRKKCAFLRHVVRRLLLENVTVLEKRVEDVEGLFDVAVTRALFTAGDFLNRAGRLLREGGFLLLGKGPGFGGEMDALPPGVEAEVRESALPGTGVRRYLVRVSPWRLAGGQAGCRDAGE